MELGLTQPIATPSDATVAGGGFGLYSDREDRQRVRPGYFGSSAGQLFGIVDEPAMSRAIGRGVVLCHPHGADYDSAFRFFRVLAARLARAGFHVLRFDYTGAGDSSGDFDAVSTTQWTSDIANAVQHLRTLHGLQSVSLVGLRLGATLAAFAARTCAPIDRIVLWEPVIDGGDYLAEQLELHRTWIADESRSNRATLASRDDLLGYPLTDALRRDLGQVDLLSPASVPARCVHVVHQPSTPVESLISSLRGRGVAVTVDCIDGPAIWSRTPSMPDPQSPNAALQAIAARLAEVIE